MSDDFRYDDAAHTLEENLEEVLESHQEEKAAELRKQAAPPQMSALERIARGSTADQLDLVVEQTRKSASDVLAEHRVREILRGGLQERHDLVDNFLESASE